MMTTWWFPIAGLLVAHLHQGRAGQSQVIPQKANVTYINEKYITYGRAYIKRYGRNSPYYINIEGEIKYAFTNNVTVNLLFYQYLHNEYRRSFVEMHFKWCDLIDKEPYIGKMIQLYTNIRCPVLAGEYHMLNMTVPFKDFPFVFPFEKGRVDADFSLTDTKEVLAKAYFYVVFKQKP